MLVGNIVNLSVDREDGVHAWLVHANGDEWKVPVSQLEDHHTGKSVKAFIYTEAQGQSVATTSMPLATLHQCANLKVTSLAEGGAFLDWGIEKELLLPFAEQRRPLQPGQSECVWVYLDNSGRLAASSKLDLRLPETSDTLRSGEAVSLLAYQRTDLGFKCVINHQTRGLLFKDEIFKPVKPGDALTGYIKQIRTDGRIDLTLQKRDVKSRNELTDKIIDLLKAQDGTLKLHDKSPPEEIYATFNVSKKVFKKALSTLYKQRKISIHADSISLVE
jgi:predicted RNA-binding protein (virulence factor B family)